VKALLVLSALAAAGSTACFFDPREAEPGTPFDTTSTRWRPASSPGVLIRNVLVTYEDQQIDFYDRAFSDAFLFRADPLDSTDEAIAGRFPFVNWDEVKEHQATDRIFINADRIHLVLSSLSPPDSVAAGDSVRVRKVYELSVVDVDSTVVDSTFYKGTLTFYMRQPGTDWVLYRWEDLRAPEPGIKSWGALRALNAP
jgi:hypothetical protein